MARAAGAPKAPDENWAHRLIFGEFTGIARIDEDPFFGTFDTDRSEGGGGSGDVNVRGYRRSNGTWVRAHTRSRPDGSRSNNKGGR